MWKFLRTFYGFILKRKLAFAGFIALVIIATILQNITPYFFKLFVDEIPKLNYSNLIRLLYFFIAVNVTGLLFNIVSFWAGDYIVFNSAKEARLKIFSYVQSLDFAFHTGKSTGSLISAFKRGDSAFFTLFFEIHHRILDIAVAAFVMFFFFSRLDYRIVIFAFLSIAITLVVTKFLISFNIKKRTIFNKEEDEISGILTDNLINYETVKLFAKEKWEERRLTDKFGAWIKALWNYGNSFRLIDFSIGAVTNLGLFLILFISLGNSVHLRLTVGDFVLVTTFVGLFFSKLWELVFSLRDIAKTYADIEIYFGLLRNEVTVKDPEKPIKLEKVSGRIHFNNVSFSYKDGKQGALKNFDLRVKKGESIAIVGKSGSGKTTLIKLLMRFFDTTKGEITIDGVNIKTLTKDNLRGLMGVVPQEPILFNNTIAYNIAYGGKGDGATALSEIEQAANLANIDEFIESMPKKYETQVGERGVKLSGGQKQRLAIARMILSNPSIIIFDEATSQLDSESEKLIQDAFWKVREGKTTIIIAHRLSTVARADRIVVMEEGKIKEIGTHQELLKNKDSLYKHFWDLQIKLD
ncbi:MAG: ABC transporter ATP-binding protein [Candidatus Woesebacteria bacterium]|nr:ABC transporter ATP-binding protein [Candidatus Woesebacteria bacterium]